MELKVGHLVINENTNENYGILIKKEQNNNIVFRLGDGINYKFQIISDELINSHILTRGKHINSPENQKVKNMLLKYYRSNILTENEVRTLSNVMKEAFPNGIPFYDRKNIRDDNDNVHLEIGHKILLSTTDNSSVPFLDNEVVIVLDLTDRGIWVKFNEDNYFLFYRDPKNNGNNGFSGISRYDIVKHSKVDKVDSVSQTTTLIHHAGLIAKIDIHDLKVVFPELDNLIYDIASDKVISVGSSNSFINKDYDYFINEENDSDSSDDDNGDDSDDSDDSSYKYAFENFKGGGESENDINEEFMLMETEFDDYDINLLGKLNELDSGETDNFEFELYKPDVLDVQFNDDGDRDGDSNNNDNNSDNDYDSDYEYDIAEEIELDSNDINVVEVTQQIKRVDTPDEDRVYKDTYQISDLYKTNIESVPIYLRDNEIVIENIKQKINKLIRLKNNNLQRKMDKNLPLVDKLINGDINNLSDIGLLPIVYNIKKKYLRTDNPHIEGDEEIKYENNDYYVVENFFNELNNFDITNDDSMIDPYSMMKNAITLQSPIKTKAKTNNQQGFYVKINGKDNDPDSLSIGVTGIKLNRDRKKYLIDTLNYDKYYGPFYEYNLDNETGELKQEHGLLNVITGLRKIVDGSTMNIWFYEITIKITRI